MGTPTHRCPGCWHARAGEPIEFTTTDGASRHGRFHIRPTPRPRTSPPKTWRRSPRTSWSTRSAHGWPRSRSRSACSCNSQAEPGDGVTDARMPCPGSRAEIPFGTITLTARVDDQVPERRRIIFDPVPRVTLPLRILGHLPAQRPPAAGRLRRRGALIDRQGRPRRVRMRRSRTRRGLPFAV